MRSSDFVSGRPAGTSTGSVSQSATSHQPAALGECRTAAAGGWSLIQLILAPTWVLAPNGWPARSWLIRLILRWMIGGDQTSLLTGRRRDDLGRCAGRTRRSWLVLVAVMAAARPAPVGQRAWRRTAVIVLAGLLAATLALLLPDYRLIATIGYTPVVASSSSSTPPRGSPCGVVQPDHGGDDPDDAGRCRLRCCRAGVQPPDAAGLPACGRTAPSGRLDGTRRGHSMGQVGGGCRCRHSGWLRDDALGVGARHPTRGQPGVADRDRLLCLDGCGTGQHGHRRRDPHPRTGPALG